MRTTILVPDEIVDRVSERATAMGMIRSAFFARAVQRYLDALNALDAESLTVQIESQLGGGSSTPRTMTGDRTRRCRLIPITAVQQRVGSPALPSTRGHRHSPDTREKEIRNGKAR